MFIRNSFPKCKQLNENGTQNKPKHVLVSFRETETFRNSTIKFTCLIINCSFFKNKGQPNFLQTELVKKKTNYKKDSIEDTKIKRSECELCDTFNIVQIKEGE